MTPRLQPIADIYSLTIYISLGLYLVWKLIENNWKII